ncbi:MAG TPA: xylulokinase [Candidatus Acidoferrum sp.]|nr:xylulokinase [Candidatus Acidoferrum sp.]
MTEIPIYFLGIDVGTGGTRALLMDSAGAVVASGTEEHQPFASPQPGWAEQDPRDWWRACGIAVKKALQKSPAVHADQIACIGFSGQMHGAVLLDSHGEVVRPALIWCDQRTEKQSQDLSAKFGTDKLIQLTCNPPLTNFTLTKILWVRENEPQLWARVRYIMLPKDYVRFRLTGDRAIDQADASGTLLLDVANRKWSREILSGTGIDENFLPQLFESPDVCGRLNAEGAAATGLKVGTPVVAGAGDQAAGAVGMGIVRAGVVSATIGTSGVVFAATDRPALDPRGRLHTFCHAIPGRWHVMGVTQAAGLSLRWFRDTFGVDRQSTARQGTASAPEAEAPTRDPYEFLSAEAAAAPAGAEGLLWAPYLMGERTPHLDPNARGALVGITPSHHRGHILRAILEGVAFSLKDSFSIFDEMKVPVTQIRLGGGGARSPLWRQIQADVYSHEVEIVAAEEGAAYGAAILAAVGAKQFASVDEACDAVIRVATRVPPNPASSALLQKNYARFRRLYPALHSI